MSEPAWRREAGQSTVEWIGLLLLVTVLLVGLAAAGARIPGAGLARSIAARIVCSVDLTDACKGDPELVAAYGAELAGLARDHAPRIAYERGMRALPVDFRRCRDSSCGDGAASGLVWQSRSGEPVVAFVHVVDCRSGRPGRFAAGDSVDCSGTRAGNLYVQYWLYYADSATLRGVPVAGADGYHQDDWEGYQVRIGPDGEVDARASSHHGYNYEQGRANWGSDAGIGPLKDATELVGARPKGGWGRDTGSLFVSGGSHAGNAKSDDRIVRVTPRRRLTLIALEPIARQGVAARFSIVPPWRKKVWRDPEEEGTD